MPTYRILFDGRDSGQTGRAITGRVLECFAIGLAWRTLEGPGREVIIDLVPDVPGRPTEQFRTTLPSPEEKENQILLEGASVLSSVEDDHSTRLVIRARSGRFYLIHRNGGRKGSLPRVSEESGAWVEAPAGPTLELTASEAAALAAEASAHSVAE